MAFSKNQLTGAKGALGFGPRQLNGIGQISYDHAPDAYRDHRHQQPP